MGLDLASMGAIVSGCRQPCCKGQADRGQYDRLCEGLTRGRLDGKSHFLCKIELEGRN